MYVTHKYYVTQSSVARGHVIERKYFLSIRAHSYVAYINFSLKDIHKDSRNPIGAKCLLLLHNKDPEN